MTQAPKNPTGAILWLHDHGETNPSEFATIAQSHVPYLNIHCPAAQLNQFGHATKPTYSWFAVDAKVIKHETTTRPEGLSDSVKYVHERLDHLRSVLSIESDRIIVGGFGHGGALAIAAALAYRSKLAGVLCHSGYVAEPRNELAHLLTNHSTVPNLSAPFMLIHGHEDETVEDSAATAAASVLRAIGCEQVILRMFEEVPHKMLPQTLGLLVDFFRSRLPVEAPKAKPAEQQGGPAKAKSGTVIKMNGRNNSARGDAAPPPPDIAAGRPTTTDDAFAVFADKPVGRARMMQPQINDLRGGLDVEQAKPAAPAKPSPPPPATKSTPPAKGASPPPPPKKSAAASEDAATAAAIAKGDSEALRQALEKRGEDKPLGEAEMLAIAQVMLGGKDGAEGVMEHLQASISKQQAAADQLAGGNGNTTKGGGGNGGQAKKKAPPPEPAFIDSDDEEQVEEDEPEPYYVSDPTPTPTPPPKPPPPPPKPPPEVVNYSMGEVDGELQLVINLPEVVTSMAQLSVDLSANALEVAVEEKPYLQVPFERAIDEDAARAKFVKKAKELRINVPFA